MRTALLTVASLFVALRPLVVLEGITGRKASSPYSQAQNIVSFPILPWRVA
jgi:hypothetical protein